MKRIFVCGIALFSSLAFGTTLNSIQLLNPAGSTAGQAILSTGPSGAPVWGAVPLTGITGTLAITNGGTGATSASVARTNLGLGTAATQNTGTSGATIPLLNGTNTWAAAQTFSVRPTFNGATPYDSANLTISNYAPLASPTFTGTVTAAALQTTGLLTVSSLNGIAGTPTNNNANAGSVGEYLTATTASTAATNATPLNSASISLTAGDWDVQGSFVILPAGSTTISGFLGSLSTTSATHNATLGNLFAMQGVSFLAGQSQYFQTPVTRISLASTTTVYLVVSTSFSVSTCNVGGLIRARRVR
jgi:hypothetical protein